MGSRTEIMGDEDYSIEAAGDAGAAATQPMEAGQIRKGGFIMIKGQPCKVVDVSTSKTGKHGHAKCHFVALNIFTGKKQELCPSTHNAEVPFVKRNEYQVMDIGDGPPDGYLTLMTEDGDMREDIKFPNEHEDDAKVNEDIVRYFEDESVDCFVTVLVACGKEKVLSCTKKDAS